MDTWLIWPPIAFVAVLLVVLGLSALLSRMAPKAATQSVGKLKAYACGEDFEINQGQPEYGQFFPFAIFFTIMHVVALVVATAPAGQMTSVALAVAYVLVAAVGLAILFRS